MTVTPYESNWDRYEWQEYALGLIRERHGAHNCQRVPDKSRGDYGIEAFTFDGCVYQCYVPDADATLKQRTERIEKKIRTDVGKLVHYADGIHSLLGTLTIDRWILLVPLFDGKDAITEGRKQESEAVHELPFIGEDFRVLVHDQRDFSEQIEAIRRRAGNRITISVPDPKNADISAWEATHSDLSQRIKDKLRRGYQQEGSTRDVAEPTAEFIGMHLRRANYLEALRNEMPDLWDSVMATLKTAEVELTAIGPGSGNTRDVLLDHINRLRNRLSGDLRAFHSADVDTIAHGTVSDWLLRCPLDFNHEQ